MQYELAKMYRGHEMNKPQGRTKFVFLNTVNDVCKLKCHMITKSHTTYVQNVLNIKRN